MRYQCFRPSVAAVLLTASIACGSQGPTQPGVLAPPPPPSAPPSPTPPPPVPIETVPASSGGVPGVHRRDVVVSHTGTATVVLRWPDAHYSLQLYVTSGACADIAGLLRDECTVVGRTRPGDLPGIVSSRVGRGDLITVWVLNTDPVPQSFTAVVEMDE